MKIISMHIYGFGKIENLKIENLADFQVFYGENEAGKSTIMAFIHGILFGFPTKQQTELRYEPKHSSKYGGNIKIFSEKDGFVLIERVKGKAAAGDVSVIADKGVTGGEDLLNELLSHMDKGLFQAIFSFNLHGLQNIHQMKGEDIGKFLFSAGTLGTERLSAADHELQKELELRFKPGGKKPLLNEKLQEVHHLNSELKAAAAKNQDYEQYIRRQDQIQQEMGQIRENLQLLHEKIDQLNEWKKIEPLVKEKILLEAELNEMGSVIFPARGIERYEKLAPLLHTYEARISSLKKRIAEMKKNMETIQPNSSILDRKAEILAVVEKYPAFEQSKQQESQVGIKLGEVEEKISIIREKLHLPLHENEIVSINTNIYMKDQVETLSREGQTLQDIQQELENRFNEEKDALETIEADVRFAQTNLLSDADREQLVKQVNGGIDRNRIEFQRQAVRDKIELYQQAKEQQSKQTAAIRRQKQIQYTIFAVLFICLGCYGWYSDNMFMLLAGGLGLIAAVMVLIRNMRQTDQIQTDLVAADLLNEEKALSRQLESKEMLKSVELQEKLAQDQHQREQLQGLLIQLKNQQNHYEKVIEKFENLESEIAQHKQKLKKVSEQLQIPEHIANAYLLEAFQLIEKYKTAIREKQQLQTGLEKLKEIQREFEGQIDGLTNQLLLETGGEPRKTVYTLQNKLKAEQERNIQWKEQQTKQADAEADLRQVDQEYSHFKAQSQQLLQEAHTDTEERFYELGAKAEKQATLKSRLHDLGKQLELSFLNHQERATLLELHNCDESISDYHQKTEELQTDFAKLLDEQASLKYEIQKIEDGGLYSELLHQYKQKQFELEEAAKEWAVFALAQDILLKTIEKYKHVHLPKMLSKAEVFLSFLTDSHYQKILPHTSGSGFLIVGEDGTAFEANELSQATTEQVYVAVRLALATTIYENYRLPIIIDDSFVNFDAKRTQKMIALLKKLKHNQIIFFTCHEHLLKFFQSDQLIYLNEGAAGVLTR